MSPGMRRDGIQAAVLRPVDLARAGARARPREDSAVADAAGALVVSRLLVWAAGAAAVALWGLGARVTLFDPGAVTRPFGAAGNALVAPRARCDRFWHLAISNDAHPPDDPPRAAFFPLYPLLARAAYTAIRDPIVAG